MTPDISIADLAGSWRDGGLVVDVREPDEYEDAHIPGAVSMPMATVPAEHETVPRDRPVYVVCAVGGRSSQVAEYLGALGVDAHNVAGGTQAWMRAGLPVATGDEPGTIPGTNR